jgi:maltose O-acetyltransferase
MNSTVLYLLNRLLPWLPDTRMYSLRARLWRIAGVDIEATAMVVSSVRIMGRFSLSIGAGTFVGHQVLIVGGDSHISIGTHCDIGPRVTIVNGTHELGHSGGGERAAGLGISKPIVIGDGVWVGAGSTILGGVTIGRRAVIGAGSLVSGDIPPDTIGMGVPCRPTKRWDSDASSWVHCT